MSSTHICFKPSIRVARAYHCPSPPKTLSSTQAPNYPTRYPTRSPDDCSLTPRHSLLLIRRQPILTVSYSTASAFIVCARLPNQQSCLWIQQRYICRYEPLSRLFSCFPTRDWAALEMQASTGTLQRPDVVPEPGRAIQAKEHTPLRELSHLNDSNSRENTRTRVTTKPAEDECSGQPDQQERKQPLTIKQLRETAQNKADQNATKRKKHELANVATQVPQKKKSSLFGGLFQVKEPTQVALNQVAAQMIAQHGSISPTKIPNVRLEKMPEHVPKVNSKWDGIPDSVRQREKREKEAAKALKKDLFSGNGSHSGSSATGDDSRRRLHSRNSSSTTGSFNSRGRSVGSNSNSGRTRFYAQSVNSSGDLASQQREERPKPHGAPVHSHSPSASSLPESVVEPLPEIPHYLRQAIVTSGSLTNSSIQKGLDQNPQRPLVTIRLGKQSTTNAQCRSSA